MNENLEPSDELIKLSKILETLREDAFEVSDLLIKGIDYYKVIAYIALAMSVFFTWQLSQYISSGNVIQSVLYGFFVFIFIVGGIYGIWKNRQLKKKYDELIEIHNSLSEE